MSTQLRLVETPGRPAMAGAAPTKVPRRARTVRGGRGRRVHWAADWRLDARTRAVGREGVAAARDALARANRPEHPLSKAS